MTIRKMEKRDYGAYCALLREVHFMHAENRPDIFREQPYFPDEDEIKTHIRYITDEFNEPRPGGRKRLALVLEIMLFTHYSANMRRHADELVQHLD